MMTRHPADLGDERLAKLLTAASAPARPGELDREDEAVRVYRSFRPVAPPPRARRVIARVAVVKTAVALAMLGGVALAAKSSRIPEPPDVAHQTGTTDAGERDVGDGSPAPVGTEEPPASPSSRPGSSSSSPSDSASPPADFDRLCRVFLKDHAEARRDPGFPALAEEAGGRKRVDAFCRDRLDAPGQNGDDGDEGGEAGNPGDVPDPDSVDKGRKPPSERSLVTPGTDASAL